MRGARHSSQSNRRTNKMYHGQVTTLLAERGFGFIRRDDGGEDVFVHVRALRETGLAALAASDRVEFELRPSPGKRGKMEAYSVRRMVSVAGPVRFGEPRL
jgi:CspA family cold shock protein